MGYKILLVDDDVELVGLFRDYLERDGFEVTAAHDGKTGIEMVHAGPVDIVVLDVMMSGMSGIQALAQIRAMSSVPIIMLTALGDDADRIIGLELGADDYVPKPCTPREVAARIRAILKRVNTTAIPSSQPIRVGSLTIWPAQRRVERSGEALDLTSTEFNLLELLVRKAGQPVSKSELSLEGLGRPWGRFDRTIDVHICSIRQKLGNLADGRSMLQTVIRKGYQMVIE